MAAVGGMPLPTQSPSTLGSSLQGTQPANPRILTDTFRALLQTPDAFKFACGQRFGEGTAQAQQCNANPHVVFSASDLPQLAENAGIQATDLPAFFDDLNKRSGFLEGNQNPDTSFGMARKFDNRSESQASRALQGSLGGGAGSGGGGGGAGGQVPTGGTAPNTLTGSGGGLGSVIGGGQQSLAPPGIPQSNVVDTGALLNQFNPSSLQSQQDAQRQSLGAALDASNAQQRQLFNVTQAPATDIAALGAGQFGGSRHGISQGVGLGLLESGINASNTAAIAAQERGFGDQQFGLLGQGLGFGSQLALGQQGGAIESGIVGQRGAISSALQQEQGAIDLASQNRRIAQADRQLGVGLLTGGGISAAQLFSAF